MSSKLSCLRLKQPLLVSSGLGVNFYTVFRGFGRLVVWFYAVFSGFGGWFLHPRYQSNCSQGICERRLRLFSRLFLAREERRKAAAVTSSLQRGASGLRGGGSGVVGPPLTRSNGPQSRGAAAL